ncbi:MAG: PucR family transcriptional regulator [Bacillota bacterium]
MPITVKSILKLNIFNNIKAIAGKSGLNRIVKRVSVIDCPIDGTNLIEKKIFSEGDFFISNFCVVKDDTVEMLKLIEFLNLSKSCCLCIVDQYLTELPDEIVNYANKNSYPVILIDQDTPYGDIIRDVMELIVLEKIDVINEIRINNLLNSNNERDIAKAANEINCNFKENVITLYSTNYDNRNEINRLIEDINKIKTYSASACLFKNGVIIILTFDKNEIKYINNKVNYIIERIKCLGDSQIGISNVYTGIEKIKKSISEAQISCDIAKNTNKDIIYYNHIGIYKLLTPLIDKSELEDFCKKYISPIKRYDEKYKSNLLETAINFINNDGNYKKVATIMYQHENTIRHRIIKLKQILNMEDKKIEFYSNLYIAIKAYALLTAKGAF